MGEILVWVTIGVIAFCFAAVLLSSYLDMYVDELWDELLDAAYSWWDYLCLVFRRKEKQVTSASNPGPNNMGIRCMQCKRDVTTSWLCRVCGPSAALENYVIPAGGYASGGMVQVSPGQQYSYTVGANSPLVCGTCWVSIPSGQYCSLPCLQQGQPNLGIYNSAGPGCWDCGSFVPPYHPGCPQQGRVTGFLPIPGPAGSNGMTQALASALAPPKPPIRVNGMSGYSEKGTPDDWDMAVGAIRGYRWFRIEVPESWVGVRNREVRKGFFGVTGKPEVRDDGMRELKDDELPSLIGAYSGLWEDGKNEAKCRRKLAQYPGNGFTHEPPEIREACGCGFWAYFDANLACSSVLSGWEVASRAGWAGMAVLGCVEGSGRVIVGEKGFRAQYAKITALAVGQNSMPRLMWWLDSGGATNIDARSLSQAISQYDYGATEGRVQCSDEETFRRLSKVEDMLARKYPSARVMTSEATLRSMFPPDDSYRSS